MQEYSVCANFAHTAADGKIYQTNYYNLDAIISVGYRVNSYQATQFRIWATQTLKEYTVKGFVLNDERLKQGGRFSAVADNDSARELMQQEKLREMTVVLAERLHARASIDRTIKETVRSKLRVKVKRTLRQQGCPPDMQKLGTDTVPKQAERLAEELVGQG